MIYHGGVSVLAEDDNTMDAADKALINDFILDEAYRDYDPGIADPVKRHTNTYVARYRSGEFIRVYLHLLTQYPGDMILSLIHICRKILGKLPDHGCGKGKSDDQSDIESRT